MDNLFKWYIFIAIYISILSAACLCVPGAATICLEESGSAVGVGNHTIELSAGNLSYNLSASGEVSAWRVVCCNNTGMWEIDL